MSQKEFSPDPEEIQEILKLGTDLREYSQEIEKELVKVNFNRYNSNSTLN